MKLMTGRKPIYVETTIHTDMETLWAHTQHPELHRQWDLRFTDITYNDRPHPSEPQTFTYLTRIGFGFAISGTGETRTTISQARDERLSTLSFGSDQRLSLISRGAGYWKYSMPESGQDAAAGIRFVTQYDYRTRFGWTGRVFDRWAFRPLFGYATAWSFDMLRLWLEEGIPPRIAIRQAVVHYVCVAALACLWICQGLLPKLLFPETGELAVMQAAEWIPGGWAPMLVKLLGAAEIGIGLASLAMHRSRRLLVLQISLLLLLGVTAAAGNPALLLTPFNPAALGVGMIALCAGAMLTVSELPSAKRCLRKPQSNGGR